MLKEVIAGTVCFFLVLGMSVSFGRAQEDLSSEDQEKMEKLEEMFSSPYSEEMYYRTDRLLLTATGSLVPVHKAPSVASVITSEDIEKIGATTLDEALETVPGLHVVPSKINFDSVYSIRGIHTGLNPQVLMLINGLPFTMLYSGSRPATFRMPVSAISRIEVIRGPGSAVYGADAFAGVINIITKDGFEIDGTRGGVRAGSFDTYDYWLQEGGNWSGWNVALSCEYLTSNGDDDRIIDADAQTALDSVFSTSASLAPGPLDTSYNIFDGHLNVSKGDFTFRFWSWLQNNGGMGAGVTQVLAPQTAMDNRQYLADMIHKKSFFQDNFELTTRLSYIYRHEDVLVELFPSGAMLPIGSDGNINLVTPIGLVLFPDGVFGNPQKIDKQTSFEIAGLYSGFNRHRLRLASGFKLLEEDFEEYKNFGPGVIDGTVSPVYGTLTNVTNTPYIFMEDQYRKLIYGSFQDEWSLARNWELTAGIRFDHYSDFGDTFNPRLALVWDTRYDLTTKFLYGKAFRAPSFTELYTKNNPVNLGNPDLKPEKIQTYELVFDYQPSTKIHNVLNLFYYDVKDLIDIVEDPTGGTSTAQNSKDQKGYGFEFETAWEITGNLLLKTNLSFQRSKDKKTKEIVPDAPALQFYINPHWTFLPNWSADCQVFWIGERHRASNDTREDIQDYTITNITIRRKNIYESWEFAFSVKNIFNENAREPSSPVIPNDFPLEGRSVYGEIRFHY